MTEEEKQMQQRAITEINSRRAELIKKFIEDKRPLRLPIFSFFMAGSPGAGKSEFVRRYMAGFSEGKLDKNDRSLRKKLAKNNIDINSIGALLIKIDVDDIREFISLYQKSDASRGLHGNSHVVQKAANIGLEEIRKYCFKEGISFLHDGTFGNYETMRELVKKSLRQGRIVKIFYIYLDPLSAWSFTKAREAIEGRNIVKEKFIEQFFASKDNVDRIKEEFGERVQVDFILKNKDNEVVGVEFNVGSIDKFLDKVYNDSDNHRYSKGDLQNLIF